MRLTALCGVQRARLGADSIGSRHAPACPPLSSEEPIPFGEVLDAAPVRQKFLANIMDNSLILGNGDLNGLLLTRGGARVRMVSPWATIVVRTGDADRPRALMPGKAGIVELDTRPAQRLVPGPK